MFEECVNYCCGEPRKLNGLEKVRWEGPQYRSLDEESEWMYRYTKYEHGTKKCYFWKQSQLPLSNHKNNISKDKQYKYE
tara:strand:+ start:2662 stop:2898 length:237 start_codon:yes stop_codon:yes gene_type:complete